MTARSRLQPRQQPLLTTVDLLNTCLDPSSRLIEIDFLPCNQALLQGTPDRHSLHRTFQCHREFCVIQTTRSELVRFRDKGVSVPAIIMRRDFSSDSGAVMNRQHILRGIAVDSQLAARSSDLSAVFLPSSHHTTAEELSDLAVVELHDACSVVSVIVLPQLRADGCDTHGRDGFDL